MKKIALIFFLTVLSISGLTISVNHAHALIPEQYYELDSASLNLDDQTVARGYAKALFDPAVVFTVPPKALNGATAIDFRKLAITDTALYPGPYGFTQISPIFEFSVRDRAAYDGRIPFIAQLSYQSETLFPKHIFYYNPDERVWRKLPTNLDEKKGIARVSLARPYIQIAVFEHTGIMQSGRASWYRYKKCDCAASPDYPKGTKLKVTNLDTGASVIVTINDWGPERDIFPDRVIDLDAVAFKKIGKTTQGTIPVSVIPVGETGVASAKKPEPSA